MQLRTMGEPTKERSVAALKQAEKEIRLLRSVDRNYDWLADAVRKLATKVAVGYPDIEKADPPEQMYALADAIDDLHDEISDLKAKLALKEK